MTDFKTEIRDRVAANAANAPLKEAALAFLRASIGPQYSYNFHWMDRPIIQYPQDMVAMQELIWEVKPDLIIETGIAHGGSLILSASILALLDMCEAIGEGRTMDPAQSRRKVLGIDIDIRAHNRAAIDAHPMRSRIEMIEGSSIDANIVTKVHDFAKDYQRVLVCLDSNHTHDHVRAELDHYAPLASVASYCVVFDTLIEDMGAGAYPDRPWGPGDNPKTAVWDFVKTNPDFVVDEAISDRLLISVAGGGFLRRVR
jgi:cephalosporin hydroxylase